MLLRLNFDENWSTPSISALVKDLLSYEGKHILPGQEVVEVQNNRGRVQQQMRFPWLSGDSKLNLLNGKQTEISQPTPLSKVKYGHRNTHREREREREREKKERIRRGGRGRRRKMKRTEPQNKLREEGSTPNKTNQKNIIKKLKHFAPDIK